MCVCVRERQRERERERERERFKAPIRRDSRDKTRWAQLSFSPVPLFALTDATLAVGQCH